MGSTALLFFQGLALGTAVSVLNHLLTSRALSRWGGMPPEKAKPRVLGVYIFRYMMNFITLFLVYKNLPVLVGAAAGLTAVKNVMAVRYLLKRRG